MATTTNFGWETPDDTDLVKDGAAAMRTLGNAIDASLVDLKGGTTGQVLSKASNTDLDYSWVTPELGDITAVTVSSPITGGGTTGSVNIAIQDGTTAQKGAVQLEDSTSSTSTTKAATPNSVKTAYDLANGAIAKSLVDAKADLITATADNTPARLAVGNDGETLVADSSTSTGLRWQGNFAAGKNKIINGDFGIWQRGTSFSGTNQLVYTADRWQLNDFGGQTSNVARSTFTAGSAPVAGYEGQYFATWSRGGAGTASSYLTQKIEDVRTFAGQTVTFSFWAKAAATETLDFYIDQNFGSGGSATVGSSSTSFTLTTSWTRYSFTVTLASISGKTVGTSSFLAPTFQVQTSQGAFTIDLWGVQLEAGNTATAFQTATGTLAGELAACQRYFSKSYDVSTSPADTTRVNSVLAIGVASTSRPVAVVRFPVTMRATPTITIYATDSGTSGNMRDVTAGANVAAAAGIIGDTGSNSTSIYPNGVSTTANNLLAFHWTASIEL